MHTVPGFRPFLQDEAREIVRGVSRQTGIPVEDIMGYSRRPEIVMARHGAIWLIRDRLGWSLMRLGRFFNRDHSTIHRALRRVEQRMLDG